LYNQFPSAGIGSNDLLFLVFWQSLDAPFRLEGEPSAPEPPLEDKLQRCSASKIPSASATICLVFGKSTGNISGNPCV
jgi:hypothetical protein